MVWATDYGPLCEIASGRFGVLQFAKPRFDWLTALEKIL